MKKIAFAAAAVCALMSAAPMATAGNPLEALGGIVSAFTATSKFEIADIQGTWSYQAPAVSFQSDNALNKIGGVAARQQSKANLNHIMNASDSTPSCSRWMPTAIS